MLDTGVESMNKKRIANSLMMLSLVVLSIFAYAFASGNSGFEVYETRTRVWDLDLGTVYVGGLKSFNVTVECKEESGEFYVTYFLEISGPETLCNDYLRLSWRDTDGADFTIGKDGDQTFSDIGTITWNSSAPTVFEAGHKNNITLTLTFLTLDALGDYNAKMWVAFIEKPIQAQVFITPQALNVKSEGEWIQACIRLPAPYNVKDVGINSVKLEYKDSFVQAEWERITGNSLLVKFSRSEVIKMLESEEGKVNLIVTGLVNGVKFYGTDTITVIKPRR
jgi:hypothetical protein